MEVIGKQIQTKEVEMSVSEISRFNEAVKNSKELQDEVKCVGTDLDKIVGIANQKGFDFTVSELEELSKNKEISEADLGGVAGGLLVAIVAGPDPVVAVVVGVIVI